ncbi:hypothetical protein L1987_23968 [Smallanthus sonchifolius]|uniref:Uncharacterized protein n=1 Tax=Smallanthus sonchifolius TaxID=185202 RepID=A0ACB9IIY2_9ASTR|nr:hypothetical protein L1987_23968 [Smallanthus sonchifolius]
MYNVDVDTSESEKVGEIEKKSEMPLDVEPISQYFSNEVEVRKERKIQWEWEPINQNTMVGESARTMDIEQANKTIGNTDVVFRSVNNLKLTMSIIQSLKPGEKVYNNIIDAWVESLKPGEKVYNNIIDAWVESLKPGEKVYNNIIDAWVEVDWMLNKTESNRDERYKRFNRNMYGGICGNKLMTDLKHFDMVLFPLLEHGHYYLLIFELKNGAKSVIGNFHESIALVGLKDSEDYFKKDAPYKIVHGNADALHKMCEKG